MGQQENFLKTKRDLQKLAEEMIHAVLNFQSKEGAGCKLGETSAIYGDKIAWMEGFLRPLFGLIPLTMGGFDSNLWDHYRRGIISGTDPQNPEYWGDINVRDQRQVEMVTIGLALAMKKDKLWDPLSEKEKKQLSSWLYQVNQCELAENNWLFFPVIVNLGLKKVMEPYNQKVMETALCRIEDCYLGNGWYSDGISKQRDYYIAFAMHFYGLIYAVLAGEEDSARAERFRTRAALFAKEFIYWFSSEGDALPYGRSLTYRFAMCAFWAALAYADIEAVPWGVMKGIVLRNIRWWMRQSIFDKNGILTIGYAYPNLKMAEFYNAPGSPAWAMKAFLVLGLPDTHPFWQAQEEPLPKLEQTICQTHPYMIIMRNKNGSHVQALTAGQYAAFEPTGMAAKYEKFAYSNVFGFSIQGGEYGLEQIAPDSMLALAELGDEMFRVRRKCEKIYIKESYLYSQWRPWNWAVIDTWLIPCNPWHIRVHRINSERPLETAEGAYSVPLENDLSGESLIQKQEKEENNMAGIAAFCKKGGSGIMNISGNRKEKLLQLHPNTNLLYPNTVLPILEGYLPEGENWLCSLVLGEEGERESKYCWENPPRVFWQKNELVIERTSEKKNIMLGE